MNDPRNTPYFKLPRRLAPEDRETIAAVISAALSGVFLYVVLSIVIYGSI